MKMKSQRQLARANDDGFTLLELMIVVLIIAVLLGIAIPTFLLARNRSHDRAAQSQVRNAFTVEMVYYADGLGTFTEDPVELESIDSSLAYTQLPDTMQPGKNVYVDVDDTDSVDDTVVLGAKSTSGRCYWLRQVGGRQEPRFATTTCSGVTDVPAAGAFQDKWE